MITRKLNILSVSVLVLCLVINGCATTTGAMLGAVVGPTNCAVHAAADHSESVRLRSLAILPISPLYGMVEGAKRGAEVDFGGRMVGPDYVLDVCGDRDLYGYR